MTSTTGGGARSASSTGAPSSDIALIAASGRSFSSGWRIRGSARTTVSGRVAAQRVTWPCCHPAGPLYARGPPDVLALVSALEELGAAVVGHAPQLVAGTGCREGLRYLKGVRDGLGELRSCVWEVSCVGVAAVDLGRGSVGCHLGTGPCCTGVRRLRVVSRSAISASMASKMTS